MAPEVLAALGLAAAPPRVATSPQVARQLATTPRPLQSPAGPVLPLRFVDCTVGGGGHAALVALALEAACVPHRLLGLDRDVEALAKAATTLAPWSAPGCRGRVAVMHASYVHLAEAVAAAEAAGYGSSKLSSAPPAEPPFLLDGVLADLGVSSHQLDAAHRGFSLRPDRDGPLDMRFDAATDAAGAPPQPAVSGGAPVLTLPQSVSDGSAQPALTCADLVAHLPERELARLFADYGEERHAAAVARALVERRAVAPFTGTSDLAAVIADAIDAAERRKRRRTGGGSAASGGGGGHPATRCFQALRMSVNGETDAVAALLRMAPALLAPGGRLAIITFHSLEDRMVKRAFSALCGGRSGGGGAADGDDDAASDEVSAGTGLPAGARFRHVFKGGFATPSDAEVAANPRARSAKLRAIQRLA